MLCATAQNTNLPMCLRRCESLSLGRFAERVSTCFNLSAAEVPCKTAPFASFSGRTEKEGPARPEHVPIYEIVLVHFDKTICLFRQSESPERIILSGDLLFRWDRHIKSGRVSKLTIFLRYMAETLTVPMGMHRPKITARAAAERPQGKNCMTCMPLP